MIGSNESCIPLLQGKTDAIIRYPDFINCRLGLQIPATRKCQSNIAVAPTTVNPGGKGIYLYRVALILERALGLNRLRWLRIR